MMWAKLYYY